MDEWTEYTFRMPPDVLCEFWRREWGDSTRVMLASDIAPETNIADLYWRLTGIGREEFAALPEQLRQSYFWRSSPMGQVAQSILPPWAGLGISSFPEY